ncbi:MAG: HEAT repeat domain-containing protein [Anaerolineaceae bacterium]|nr:HEAT repeat domain-containing protein [Anaerolineaceae bacterium]
MRPITIIFLLTIITAVIFLVSQPRKRPSLGSDFWNSQEKSAIDLAKSFSYSGEVDRLVEMLSLSHDEVSHASSLRMYAAGTGIPILYHKHQISRQDTEEVINALLEALDDAPWEVLHTIMALHIGGHLGSMEEKVVEQLLDLIKEESFSSNEKILAKVCEALGLIGNIEALDTLLKVQENVSNPYVKNVVALALSRMGYDL